MPKFIFLGAPKVGLAKEFGFLVIMIAGFEEFIVGLLIEDGFI